MHSGGGDTGQQLNKLDQKPHDSSERWNQHTIV